MLYWTLLYNSDTNIDDNNLVVHLFNGLVAYIDLWVTGVPVRLYHVYMVAIFGGVYSVFTGIHHAALVIPNITYSIYPPIDYSNRPGSAAVYAVMVPLVCIPLVHLFFYISHLGREAITYVIRLKCYRENRLWNETDNDAIELKNTDHI